MIFKFQQYNSEIIEINVEGSDDIIELLKVYEQPVEYQKVNELQCHYRRLKEQFGTNSLGTDFILRNVFGESAKNFDNQFDVIWSVMSKLIPPQLNDETKAEISETLRKNNMKRK